MAERHQSLSGRWLGRFEYALRGAAPVPFEAVLLDEAGVLSGDTEEPNTFRPDAGPVLTASLAGDVSGDMVRFLKAYHGFGRHECPSYEGRVNAALTRIEGRWYFGAMPGVTGRFVMMRKPIAAARAEKRMSVAVE